MTPHGKSSPEISLLLKLLEDGFRRQTWHGPNLKGSIKGITLKEAVWRPAPGRHNIWEIVVHAAYWKYAVLRRLTGEKRGSFPLKGSNWFPRSKNDQTLWKSDVRLLNRMHDKLVEKVSSLRPASLHKKRETSRYTDIEQIYGIAVHDIYHAGQIQLLKRMQKKKP